MLTDANFTVTNILFLSLLHFGLFLLLLFLDSLFFWIVCSFGNPFTAILSQTIFFPDVQVGFYSYFPQQECFKCLDYNYNNGLVLLFACSDICVNPDLYYLFPYFMSDFPVPLKVYWCLVGCLKLGKFYVHGYNSRGFMPHLLFSFFPLINIYHIFLFGSGIV